MHPPGATKSQSTAGGRFRGKSGAIGSGALQALSIKALCFASPPSVCDSLSVLNFHGSNPLRDFEDWLRDDPPTLQWQLLPMHLARRGLPDLGKCAEHGAGGHPWWAFSHVGRGG